MRSILTFLFMCSLFCLFASSAWAKGDPCQSLARNAQWNEGISELSANYKSKNYDIALKKADELSEICSRSPILNYFRGRIYREKGDDTKALYYIQLATNSTEEFAVKGDLLERMWYERYEIEHAEARPEKIEERQKEIADLQQRTKVAEEQLSEKKTESRFTDYDTVKSYATGMWTGVAVGAVGIVLTAVGAGLYAGVICSQKGKNGNCKAIEYKYNTKEEENKSYLDNGYGVIKPEYTIANGMMWAGVSLTIVGSIFAGIFGYKYANVQNETNAIIFGINANGANLGITF